VDAIERARGPYKVNTLAERAAIAALRDRAGGRQWVLEHATLARDSRLRLTNELQRRSLEPLPSDANFVLVPLERAAQVARGLQKRGVRVRVHTQLPTALSVFAATNGEAIRIGVGPWPMMERVLEALDAVLA
jgi:histidinol-phosphate aminotransferase